LEKKKIKILKRVGFGDIVMYEIDQLVASDGSNYKFREKMWYSQDELEYINSKNQELAKRAICKGIQHVDSSKKQTIRGLEHLLHNNKLSIKRQLLQNKSRVAVFSEQRRQKQLGIHDPVLIEEAYKAHGANQCQKVAINLGLHDEDVVNKLRRKKEKKGKFFLGKLLPITKAKTVSAASA